MKPTLVVIHHLRLGDRAFAHGEELEPDFLPPEAVDKLLDAGRLAACPSGYRRSLYRLFASFSRTKEHEQLSPEEMEAYALPP